MHHLIALAKDFAGGISERRLSIYATSGCYYLFMSLVPIVMILCCLLPYTPFTEDLVLGYVNTYFSESLGTLLRGIVAAVYRSNTATLTVSILLTLWSASASMRSLTDGLNAAYGFHRRENPILYFLRAMFFLVLMVIVLVISFGVLVCGGKVIELLRSCLPGLPLLDMLLSWVRYAAVMLLLSVFFLMLYVGITSEKVRLAEQIPGALLSAAAWVVFSAAFSWYVSFSDKYGAYGYIGTIMVVMLWMHYIVLFLLIGGYFNTWLKKALFNARARRAGRREAERHHISR